MRSRLVAALRAERAGCDGRAKVRLWQLARDLACSWWGAAVLAGAAVLLLDGALCGGSGVQCGVLLAEGALVFCTVAALGVTHCATLWRLQSEKFARVEHIVDAVEAAPEPTVASWNRLRKFDSQLPGMVYAFRKGCWIPVPVNLLVERDLIVLESGREVPVHVRIEPPFVQEPLEVVPGEVLGLNTPDSVGNFGHREVAEAFHLLQQRSGTRGVRLCRVMETPARKILREYMDRAAKLDFTRKVPRLIREPRDHAAAVMRRVMIVGLVLGFAVSLARFFYRPDGLGGVHLILARQAFFVLVIVPLTIPIWEQGLELWAIAKLLALNDKLQGLKGDLSKVSANIDKDERRDEKHEIRTSARQDVSFASVLELFWNLMKVRDDFPNISENNPSSFEMANLLRLPLKRANLLENLARVTTVCCLDEQVVLAPWPTVEEIAFLRGDEQLTVLDLYEGRDGSISFEDPNWHRNLTSLKPIALACALGTDETMQGNLRKRQRVSSASGYQRHSPFSVSSFQDLGAYFARRSIPKNLGGLAKAVGFTKRDLEHYVACEILRILDDYEKPLEEPRSVLTWSSHRGRAQIISLVVEDKPQSTSQSKSLHMFSFGDPVMIASCCTEHWSGESIWPLRSEDRGALLQIDSRWAAEEFDGIAFAYTPIPAQHSRLFSPATSARNLVPIDVILSSEAGPEETSNKPVTSVSGENLAVKTLDYKRMILQQLISSQVFIGLVGSREQPRSSLVGLIEDLDAAGIRFVYFSARNSRRSLVLADKMGLETDWNTAVSLKEVLEKNKNSRDDPVWDINAKLPHGVAEIRRHLAKIDDVPLRVNTFTNSNPETTCEMIEIFEEHGDIAAVVGTGLRLSNRKSFEVASLAIAVQSKVVPSFSKKTMVKDAPSSRKPYFPSSLPTHPSHDAKGRGSKQNHDVHHMDEALPALIQLEISSTLTSLPCSLVIKSDASLSLVGDLVGEARLLISNYQQALIFIVAGQLVLAGTILVSYFLTMPDVFSMLLISWSQWIVLPILGLPMISTRPRNGYMSDMASKRNQVYKDHLRTLARNYGWYAVVRLLPTCVALVGVYIWIIVDLSGDRKEALSQVFWSSSFDKNLFDSDEVEIAQAATTFFYVWFMVIHGLTFMHRNRGILAEPPTNIFYFVSAICVICFQLLFNEIFLLVRSQDEYGAFESFRKVPSLAWVVFAIWPFAIILIADFSKKSERKLNETYQRRLRLVYKTRLGMYSPK